MNWIVAHIRWIMIVSGGLTATMVYATIAPQAALQATFGESLNGSACGNRCTQLGRADHAGWGDANLRCL
jgi:hypothetical protein